MTSLILIGNNEGLFFGKRKMNPFPYSINVFERVPSVSVECKKNLNSELSTSTKLETSREED